MVFWGAFLGPLRDMTSCINKQVLIIGLRSFCWQKNQQQLPHCASLKTRVSKQMNSRGQAVVGDTAHLVPSLAFLGWRWPDFLNVWPRFSGLPELCIVQAQKGKCDISVAFLLLLSGPARCQLNLCHRIFNIMLVCFMTNNPQLLRPFHYQKTRNSSMQETKQHLLFRCIFMLAK